jgi:hypothetical protein
MIFSNTLKALVLTILTLLADSPLEPLPPPTTIATASSSSSSSPSYLPPDKLEDKVEEAMQYVRKHDGGAEMA